MGFSFGAPHAVVAGADPALAPALAGIVAFEGYCDLPRMLRFLFLGEHEWEGQRFHANPDPYGRWIVGGNYVHRIPGLEDAGDMAAALLALAAQAGVRGLPSASPSYYPYPLKRELASRLDPAYRRAVSAVCAPGRERLGRTPDVRATVTRLFAHAR